MSYVKKSTTAPAKINIRDYVRSSDEVQSRYYDTDEIAPIDMWIIYDGRGRAREFTFAVVSDENGSDTIYPSKLAEHPLYNAAVETSDIAEHLDLIAEIVLDLRSGRA